MRNILFLLMSLLTITLNAESLRVATYNVWNPRFEERYTGQNTWDKRLPYIIDNIKQSDGDIIALQEVGQSAYNDIVSDPEILRRYASHYLPHGSGRDGLALFYRKDRLTLRQLVISQDGTRPTHRRDFYVDLSLSLADKPILLRFASTHLDPSKDLSIGNDQLQALATDVLEASQVDLVIVCGDFNEGEDEAYRPRHDIMSRMGFITDGALDSTRPETLDVRHKGHIDWIYFQPSPALTLDLIPVPPIGDEKASDHKITATDVQL